MQILFLKKKSIEKSCKSTCNSHFAKMRVPPLHVNISSAYDNKRCHIVILSITNGLFSAIFGIQYVENCRGVQFFNKVLPESVCEVQCGPY